VKPLTDLTSLSRALPKLRAVFAFDDAALGTNSTFARFAVGGWEDRSSFPNTGVPRHPRGWCDRGLSPDAVCWPRQRPLMAG
jgi:hypothetical protein